jgi:hypothetical protein
LLSNKELLLSFLKAIRKKELGTCDSEDDEWKLTKKGCHCMRDYVLFKEWLERRRIQGH